LFFKDVRVQNPFAFYSYLKSQYFYKYLCAFFAGKRDSSVGMKMGYELESGERFPARKTDFSLLHSDPTGSELHPVSYTMGIGCSLVGINAAGT
jgi:hypothetical protein